MAYSTLNDLTKARYEKVLIQIAGKTVGETRVIDEDIIDAAITKADGIIDSYLSNRFTVPFLTVPVMINTISVQLTLDYCYGNSNQIPTAVMRSTKQAYDFLEKISSGEMRLMSGSGEEIPATGGTSEVIQPFESEDMGGYTEAFYNMDTLET